MSVSVARWSKGGVFGDGSDRLKGSNGRNAGAIADQMKLLDDARRCKRVAQYDRLVKKAGWWIMSSSRLQKVVDGRSELETAKLDPKRKGREGR